MIGTLLGVVGGALIFAWQPVPRPPDEPASTQELPAQSEERQQPEEQRESTVLADAAPPKERKEAAKPEEAEKPKKFEKPEKPEERRESAVLATTGTDTEKRSTSETPPRTRRARRRQSPTPRSPRSPLPSPSPRTTTPPTGATRPGLQRSQRLQQVQGRRRTERTSASTPSPLSTAATRTRMMNMRLPDARSLRVVISGATAAAALMVAGAASATAQNDGTGTGICRRGIDHRHPRRGRVRREARGRCHLHRRIGDRHVHRLRDLGNDPGRTRQPQRRRAGGVRHQRADVHACSTQPAGRRGRGDDQRRVDGVHAERLHRAPPGSRCRRAGSC